MERSPTDRTMRIGLFYPHTVDRRYSVGGEGMWNVWLSAP